MPLNQNAINQILPFAAEGLPEAGDLMPLDEYAGHLMRRRGHLPGIALRELQNREARQATHIAAGISQFIANRYQPGVLDDGDLDKVEQGLLEAIKGIVDEALSTLTFPKTYELCEFYFFRSPVLRQGFQPARGGLLENAASLYPQAWEYLQTSEGRQLCKTEAEWQALTRAIWATLADGTTVGWNGVGGAPYFAPNLETGALRLPDIRGMYAEAAGFDSLGVGGVHGDGIRKIFGRVHGASSYVFGNSEPIGLFYGEGSDVGRPLIVSDPPDEMRNHPTFYFDNSRVVPTANKNQPRAWGAMPCVYLGQPAS